jgi:SAM-dependent methyltransferase
VDENAVPRIGPVADQQAQPDAAEIERIVARLKHEVELSGAAEAVDEDGLVASRRAVRAEADRAWAVSAERPFLFKPGALGRARGLALIPVKAVLRKLMRWYVEPLAADQRAFNAVALRLADALAEATDAARTRAEELAGRVEELVGLVETAESRRQAAERAAQQAAERTRQSLETRLDEHDDRMLRLERRPSAPAPRPSETAPPPEIVPAAQGFDYFAFETRMRGPQKLILERQRPYVAEFREAAPVLDVGCGRGEFLSLLAEAGIDARGVDFDEDMVAFCRAQGLDVEQGDALVYLAGLEEGSLGGIFAAQVVEHLSPGPLTRFLELAATRLRPGGLLLLETINPLSLFALRNYFADLTHAQPLVPETLLLLVRQAGFSEVETRFINEPPDEQLLQPVRLPEDPSFDPAREALEANRAKLNEVVFGPQDYALLARR